MSRTPRKSSKLVSDSSGLQLGRAVEWPASPDAAKLSKAALFSGASIPVTIRFSDATGVPNIPDGSKDANPHGLAMKFHLPDGSETDMVLNSLKFFPVGTGEDFRDLPEAQHRHDPVSRNVHLRAFEKCGGPIEEAIVHKGVDQRDDPKDEHKRMLQKF